MKYFERQVPILSICLTSTTLCFVLSGVQIFVVISLIIKSRKLNSAPKKIEIDQMHMLITERVRKFLYLIESLAVLCTGLLLGHFISYHTNSQIDCTWTNYNVNQILVLSVLSIIVFTCSVVGWIIIFTINMKNINKS